MNVNMEDVLASNAWPFIEALELTKRFENGNPKKGYVLFETGYGPSGLPHIGTFAEVLRTTMVRRAFEKICDIPTKLYAFSDDMDGLRKVPTNIPNQDMVAKYLGKPLTSIPDPFGTHESYGDHMNDRLKKFLDSYGFEYEFKSSTECYRSGIFDKALLKLLGHYEKIMELMLPTLGEERQATYSPFLPICQKTSRVLQVPILSWDVKKGTIKYRDDNGDEIETLITGGRCKLQWKPDWGMRWAAFDVDYEMYGKDLIPSAELSSRICSIIGGIPPNGFSYELFLDEKGTKISKSKGNGISVEDWLKYGIPESLSLFMYNSPRKAKRLYFDVIPRNVDDYLNYLNAFENQDMVKKLANPVWHIHDGDPPKHNVPVSFSVLLNLVSACNPENKSILWGFISRYAPGATPDNSPLMDKLVEYAINYYENFVKPNKRFRSPDGHERDAMNALVEKLKSLPDNVSSEEIQNEIYAIGKAYEFKDLKDWFKALYEVLFGQEQGPRMGSFIALYGRKETISLIQDALNRTG